MISIDYIDIPSYLHDSLFYRGIDRDDCSTITIPRNCFKQNTSMHCVADFDNLLHTVRFWIVDGPRLKLFTFFLTNDVSDYLEKGSERWDLLMSLPFGGKYLQLKLLSDYKRVKFAMRNDMAFAVVKRLRNLGHQLPKNMCSLATKLNRIDLLEYAFSQHCRWGDTAQIATSRGHIDCLRFAMVHHCPMDASLLQCAVQHNQRECLKCFADRFELCPSLCILAAQKGYLHCLQYLQEQNVPWDERTTGWAAKEGHLHCLIYAHQNGCPLNDTVTALACERGDVACLHYAVKHGCAVTDQACAVAAYDGHLLCLQYAHRVGGVLGANVCRAAAKHGHLHCLQYAHAKGFFWDENVLIEALWGDHWWCVVYAVVNGCPCKQHRDLAMMCGVNYVYLLVHIQWPEYASLCLCMSSISAMSGLIALVVAKMYYGKLSVRYAHFPSHDTLNRSFCVLFLVVTCMFFYHLW